MPVLEIRPAWSMWVIVGSGLLFQISQEPVKLTRDRHASPVPAFCGATGLEARVPSLGDSDEPVPTFLHR